MINTLFSKISIPIITLLLGGLLVFFLDRPDCICPDLECPPSVVVRMNEIELEKIKNNKGTINLVNEFNGPVTVMYEDGTLVRGLVVDTFAVDTIKPFF